MVSRFGELVVDCHDPHALARFWEQVLVGYRITEEYDDESVIEGDAGPTILFGQVSEPKTVKNRLHIDVNPVDREQSEEVERLIALGARKIDIGQRDVPWVVLADPEGNEFCVLARRVS